MSHIKCDLMNEAKAMYLSIFPCSGRESLEECFTVERDTVFFWFNTVDNTTRVLCARMA